MLSRSLVAAVALAAALSLLFAAPATAESPNVNTPATVTGTAAVGHQLTAHNGTWLYLDGRSCGSECVMTYQWQRCSSSCSDISGAAGRFYTVQAADAGHRVRAMETMTSEDCGAWNNAAGTQECRFVSKSAPSGQTDLVAGGGPASGATPPASSPPPAVTAPPLVIAPFATAVPEVNGLAMVDETLTAIDATWGGTSPIATSLRWERCDSEGRGCVDVGLTSNTYKLADIDVGKRLRIVSAATNAAGGRTVASRPTAVVAELKPHAGRTSLPANRVDAPHKLVVQKAVVAPSRFRRGSLISVHVQVHDSRGFRIEGAVVNVVALPTTATSRTKPVTTNARGEATLQLRVSAQLKLGPARVITLIVTARRPNDHTMSPRSAAKRITIRPRR